MKLVTAVPCYLLALAIFVAALLGPLGLSTVRFHMGHSAIVQYEGGEIVMLIVALALCLGGWMWQHNMAAAPAISLGAALFVIYTMMTVVMPQEYEQFPHGNAENYFLMYMGISAIATLVATLSVSQLVAIPVRMSGDSVRATTIFLAVQAMLFLVLWLGQIAGVYRNGLTAEIEETRLLFWLIKYLDLGIVIPLSFLTIYLLKIGNVLAPTLAIAIAGFTMWMMLAIAAMMVSQWLQNQPASSLPVAGILVAFAGWAGTILMRWLQCLEHKKADDRLPHRPPLFHT